MDPSTYSLRTTLLQALLSIPVHVRSSVFDLVYERTSDGQTLHQFSSSIQALKREHKKVLLFAIYTYWGNLSDEQLIKTGIFEKVVALKEIVLKNSPLLTFELEKEDFVFIENYY